MSRRTVLALAAIAAFASFAGSASAADPTLVGDWNFDSATSGDSTGHWSTFQLEGVATVSGGQLAVSGTGNGVNAASGWARALDYSGPTITDKTMVSWVSLDSTAIVSGSPISLYKPAGDQFDAVDYAEQQPYRWMAGSDFFRRTAGFVPNVDDTNVGSLRQIAISYQDNGDGSQTISGCLNGVFLGSYRTGKIGFDQSESPVTLFGPRHMAGGTNGAPVGSIQAHIDESRLYSRALSCSDVADTDSDQVLAESDNCPNVANADQADTDGDGQGDACDATPNGDTDNDGVDNNADNCPAVANADQADLDGDGVGDACDSDIDGDGVSNGQDAFPRDSSESVDTDGDGIGNNADTDDDNDGVPDSQDSSPLDPSNARPASADACKNGGWSQFAVDGVTFKNQGDCVSWVATAGRNSPAGH